MAVTLEAGNYVNDYFGLSTDEKPTAYVPNGSSFCEIDTGEFYFFDSDAGVWLEQ